MFLSEIHPNIRKELHKREFILERTPVSGSAARIIRQEESLNSTKENRDLLAESFARSHWIRVFSPVDTRKLVSNAWKQKLQQKRMKKPEFGVSNRYFEHTGDKELIQRSEEHTSELQSQAYLVCRLLLEKKKQQKNNNNKNKNNNNKKNLKQNRTQCHE